MWIVHLVISALQWLTFAGLVTQALLVAAVILRGAWFNAIKPMLPDPQIARDAYTIIESYSDPEDEASRRHGAAKARCDWPDQLYWQRVRKVVRRRMEGD